MRCDGKIYYVDLDINIHKNEPTFSIEYWYTYIHCIHTHYVLTSMKFLKKPGDGSGLARAIESIPAYIAKSSFFFVLSPVIQSSGDQETCKFDPRNT